MSSPYLVLKLYTAYREHETSELLTLPVHRTSVYGANHEGVYFDYTHTSGHKDRVLMKLEPYGMIRFGRLRVASVDTTLWLGESKPPTEEWRDLIRPAMICDPLDPHYHSYTPPKRITTRWTWTDFQFPVTPPKV